MPALLLRMYVGRLGEAGAPLWPRINSEIVRHLSYIDEALAGRAFLVGDHLTGADVQMSFVAEVAKAQGKLPVYANIVAWLDRLHARPAWKAALERSGPYKLGE
jgi:glutathione S-transferase